MLGICSDIVQNTQYTAFAQKWQQQQSSVVQGVQDASFDAAPDPFTEWAVYLAYDAVWTVAHAMAAVIQSGGSPYDGSAMMAALQQVTCRVPCWMPGCVRPWACIAGSQACPTPGELHRCVGAGAL